MAAITAFVSHSFIKSDEPLIGKFVTLFERVAELQPQFSWDRAIRSEPRSLSEKVMGVFEGKTALIAICTRRELVVSGPAPSPIPFTGYATVERQTLTWKTSDWILQEIGLAAGRGMTPIIILEKGVRNPAGILGDLQYIEFDRDRPEECFTGFMQMVASLTPHTSQAIATEQTGVAIAPSSEEEPQQTIDDWHKPQPEWATKDYEYALFRSIFAEPDSPTIEQEIFDAYLRSPLAESSDEKVRWAAYRELVRVQWGSTASLGPLQELAAKNPQNSSVALYLARALQKYDLHKDAARLFQQAAERATADDLRLSWSIDAAIAHLRDDNRLEAEKSFEDAMNLPSDERTRLTAVRDFAKAGGASDIEIGALERLLELDPADITLRFAVAYLYGEAGNTRLALYHYLKIPPADRTSGAWNNLANAREGLKLHSKAVTAYRAAIGEGETLAMSNLAYKYLARGFLDEARTLCDTAQGIPDYHKNIVGVLARLREIPEEEEKKEGKTLEAARPTSEFMRAFGIAANSPPLMMPHRIWQGPNCELTFTAINNDFAASGEYEKSYPIANALIFATTATRYLVEYSGRIRGRAITATRKTTEKATGKAVSGFLGIGDLGADVLMIVSEDGMTIDALENPHGVNSDHHRMTAVPTLGAN